MAGPKLTYFALALFAIGAAPFGAFAQSGEQALPEVRVRGARQAGEGYNPPTASSATKIEAPVRDVPQTVNVVPEQVLRDTRARSMQDALRTVPGIGLSHGDGQRDEVTIRGFTAIGDQFIDGLRDDALYFRDLSNIERVEVIKGPAAVLYGRGSSGGLINRITKKPGPDLTEAALSVGAWNARRAEIDFARGALGPGVGLRVTGAVERADSYRSQQFLKRESVAPSLSWGTGDTRLLVQLEHLRDRRVTDFGVPAFRGRPVDVPASTYYGAANAREADYTQAEVNAFGATLSHRFSDAWSARNAFRLYDYKLDRNNTLVGSVNEAAQTASLDHGNVRRDEVGFFNQTELVQRAEAFGLRHQILYGVELGRQNKDQRRVTRNNVATVSLFNPVLPVLAREVTGVAPFLDNRAILSSVSGYLQDMVAFSERWKALVGLRYDDFEQETRERRPDQPNLARTDRTWSPRAGVVWQPSLAQSYYASFSKSFQPSGEQFALAASNAQLAPEETINREMGAKLDFLGGQASATASLFNLERTNIKAFDPATRTLIPIGTQRTNGLELTLAGALPGAWQVYAGYAYLDGRVTESVAVDSGQPVKGKRPTLTPDHSASFWLTKTIEGAFVLGGGFNYVGDRLANPGNTVTLPRYTTFDAIAAYRTKTYDLQLNLFNVFDKRYIVAGHGTSPNLNLPGAPRNLLATVRVRF